MDSQLCPQPLHGLDKLGDRPDVKVIVTDSEEACEAAVELLPAFVAVAPSRDVAAKETDWSPLRGRIVVIWPNPKGGLTFAAAVVREAWAAGALSVTIVPPETDCDAAEARDKGWGEVRATALIEDARSVQNGDPRENLARFATLLCALGKRESEWQKLKPVSPLPSIPLDLIDWVAVAIERYLKNREETLDAAFGVHRGRGRPKTDLRHGEHFKLAEKMVWLRMTAKNDDIPHLSWAQVDSCLTEAGIVDGSNTAKLSKIHQRYQGVVVEDIVAQVLSALNDDDV